MRGKAIVNIVSEQTIPNILFIKEFGMNPDVEKYIFITTPKMKEENIPERIINVSDIDASKIKEVEVSYDNFGEIKRRLALKIVPGKYRYLVNLTGGTKVMSLAVHNFFTGSKANFYYLPINTNHFENLYTGEIYPIKYHISSEKYLKAYGYLIDIQETGHDYDLKELRNLLNAFILKQSNSTFKLNKHVKEKLKSGEWLENYIYTFLKELLKNYPHDLNIRVNIYGNDLLSNNTKNELDIVLTLQNKLYVAECKASVSRNESISEELYKLAALIKRMGLSVHGILITLNPKGVVKTPNGYKTRQELLERARLLNIEVITLADLLSEEKLSRRFKKILQLDGSGGGGS